MAVGNTDRPFRTEYLKGLLELFRACKNSAGSTESFHSKLEFIEIALVVVGCVNIFTSNNGVKSLRRREDMKT